MANQPLNTKSWKIGDTEVARYASKKGNANASSLKLYIPKIMPLISEGLPKQVVSSLSSTCFVNATECKPSVVKKIKTQNYKTVPRNVNQPFGNTGIEGTSKIKVKVSLSHDNLTGTFIGDTINEGAIFEAGAKIMVEVRNKNVDTMFVTNVIDSSSKPD